MFLAIIFFMIIKKRIADLATFIAGDATQIKEVFHPKNDQLPFNYSLAQASLAVGAASYPHILKKQSELYVFLRGNAEVFIGEESCKAGAGDIVWVPVGVKQYVRNLGEEELVFLCIVDPPWQKEDELILED